MNQGYGWQKLHLAVHSLCGEGEQAQRLVNAIVYQLIHITPDNDLPEEVRDEFKELMEGVSSVEGQNGEGAVQATVNTFDEIMIDQAIHKIIGLYDTVCRHRGQS